MLGLDQEQEGYEGLDEAGRELLSDLRSSRAGRNDNRTTSQRDRPTEWLSEEVAFIQRGRWFAASVSGVTRPNEDIGQELDRCFQSIQRRSRLSPSSINDQQPDLPDRYPRPRRSLARITHLPHHTPASFHDALPSRQCSLHPTLWHFTSVQSYSRCAAAHWMPYTPGSGGLR